LERGASFWRVSARRKDTKTKLDSIMENTPKIDQPHASNLNHNNSFQTPMTDTLVGRPVVVWYRGSRAITIYETYKIRSGYFTNDRWPVLHRCTVPTLTDEEWYAAPGPEWHKQ
jgi:hypothetical protein